MAAENNTNGSNGTEGQARPAGDRDGHTVSVDLKDSAGHPLSVRVNPRDTVHISGLSFHDAKVNILGPDVIITDPSLAKKLMLPGIGLFLFAPDEAPQFVFDDSGSVSNDDLLARVGTVINMTDKDYASFTNIDANKQPHTEQAAQEQAPIIISPPPQDTPPPPPPPPQVQTSALVAHTELVSEIPLTQDVQLTEPYTKPSSSHSLSENVIQNVQIVQEITTAFSFLPHLLQIATQENTTNGQTTVLGGNGSTQSAFDPANNVQFSTQVIDTTANPGNVLIYANDPSQINAGEMTRTLSLAPVLASGFYIPQFTVSGLPAGFALIGTNVTNNGNGSFTVTNPQIDGNGNINLPLEYTNLTPQTFTVTISMQTEFDPTSGFPTPPLTNMSYTTNIGVSVHAVSSAADYSYTDQYGNAGWVLATNPNQNIIHAGNGSNTIYGGLAANVITAGNGNNVVYDGTGTNGDAVDLGNGNNTIYSGPGQETIVGGTGSNTVNYQSLASLTYGNISVDLSVVVNSYSTVQFSDGKQDLLMNINSVYGNDGNDFFAGNAQNNMFVGGTGNNTFVASMGNDTLTGTQGANNTLDYSRINTGQGLTININLFNVTIDGSDRFRTCATSSAQIMPTRSSD